MTTPMENMISMSRGARIGRSALAEDSPLEAPVGGFNRHMSLMAPATREMVLKSRTLDIEKFAESRSLNATAIVGIAEAAMRLGRVPDLRQYGFSGDDAKAIKQFIAGDVLNIAIEQLDAMDTINEAMSDREAAKIVRDLAKAGASLLLQKNEGRAPAGYTKALNCLVAGDLLTIRNMLGENLVSFGAAKALVGAMNAAPQSTKDQIKAEATNTAGIASYMSLSSNMAHARPRTMVNAERATRIEDEKTAMKVGPRLGASPFETDVLTLEGIAAKYQEAQAEEAAAMEAADSIEKPTAVKPQGQKVKQTGQTTAKLRSAGEYKKGEFHPGSHGTVEGEAESGDPVDESIAKQMRKMGSKTASPMVKAQAAKKADARQASALHRTKPLAQPVRHEQSGAASLRGTEEPTAGGEIAEGVTGKTIGHYNKKMKSKIKAATKPKGAWPHAKALLKAGVHPSAVAGQALSVRAKQTSTNPAHGRAGRQTRLHGLKAMRDSK